MAKRVGIDKWMFGSILLLVGVGVLMVFSASAVMAGDRFGSPYHFFTRQLGWALAGLVAAVALCALGAVIWFAAGPDDFWVSAGLWARIWRLTLVMIAGGVAYFGALWLLGFRFADFNRREPP